MKRRALVVSTITAAAVISIFIGASLWWNRHASDASLRALAERQIKHNLQRDFAAVDLKSIELRDFQIARAGSTAHFSGTARIPRSRFAVGWWQDPSTFTYFQPQGSAELSFEGRADIQRQHVSAWRSLGPVRPVWVPWQIWTTANQALFDEAWDRSLTSGAEALFDAHLVSSDEFPFSRNEYQRRMQVIAIRVLTRERRYSEAISLIEPGFEKPRPGESIRDQRMRLAAQELWTALQKEGAAHAAEQNQMRKLLRIQPSPTTEEKP